MLKKLLDRFKSAAAIVCVVALILGIGGVLSRAGAPGIINYQGRVKADGVDFNGTGFFKFALINPSGTVTYWSNDGTSVAASEPTGAVQVPVVAALYSVILGDVS